MILIDKSAVASRCNYPALMDALAAGLQSAIESPQRSSFAPNHDDSAVLVMPAWKPGGIMGVKLVSIWPGNSAQGKPAVSGVYVVISCEDGTPMAVIDGTELTLRRTAAAAALGAKRLAREGSSTLAVLGTGALSVPLVQAHCAALQIRSTTVWGRNPLKAKSVVEALAALGIPARASDDLQATLAQADVVAAATTSTVPFIRADWVRPGTHLGLVGAFTPSMAEAEPELLPRCQLFADTREGVLQKGGEVYQALHSGLIRTTDLRAELSELVAQAHRIWREGENAITVFKSVGFAALDLIAAELVLAGATFEGPGFPPDVMVHGR